MWHFFRYMAFHHPTSPTSEGDLASLLHPPKPPDLMLMNVLELIDCPWQGPSGLGLSGGPTSEQLKQGLPLESYYGNIEVDRYISPLMFISWSGDHYEEYRGGAGSKIALKKKKCRAPPWNLPIPLVSGASFQGPPGILGLAKFELCPAGINVIPKDQWMVHLKMKHPSKNGR